MHITFEDEAAARGSTALRGLRPTISRGLAPLAGLDPVPLRWLHRTMQNVGFTDEIGEAEAKSVSRERASCSGRCGHSS